MKVTTNKFSKMELVSYKNDVYQIKDVISDKNEWFYELKGIDDPNAMVFKVAESKLVDVRKENGKYVPITKPLPKRMFSVHYSLYFSECRDVMASTPQEAEAEVKRLLDIGEIGDTGEMDLGERKVWAEEY